MNHSLAAPWRGKRLILIAGAALLLACAAFTTALQNAFGTAVVTLSGTEPYFLRQEVRDAKVPGKCGFTLHLREIGMREDGARIEKEAVSWCNGPIQVDYTVVTRQCRITASRLRDGTTIRTTFAFRPGAFADHRRWQPSPLFDCRRTATARKVDAEDRGGTMTWNLPVRRLRIAAGGTEAIEDRAPDLGCEILASSIVRPDVGMNSIISPVLVERGQDSLGNTERIFEEVRCAREVSPVQAVMMERGVSEAEARKDRTIALMQDIYERKKPDLSKWARK